MALRLIVGHVGLYMFSRPRISYKVAAWGRCAQIIDENFRYTYTCTLAIGDMGRQTQRQGKEPKYRDPSWHLELVVSVSFTATRNLRILNLMWSFRWRYVRTCCIWQLTHFINKFHIFRCDQCGSPLGLCSRPCKCDIRRLLSINFTKLQIHKLESNSYQAPLISLVKLRFN